jgi:hypothetical protein
MVFEKWPQLVCNWTTKATWIRKPLYDCPLCQSVWLCLGLMALYDMINIYLPLGLIMALYMSYEKERRYQENQEA